jgi:hypothetical protein
VDERYDTAKKCACKSQHWLLLSDGSISCAYCMRVITYRWGIALKKTKLGNRALKQRREDK